MALTEEQWANIMDRKLPILHRKAQMKVVEDLTAIKEEFKTLQEASSAAENAFKTDPRGGSDAKRNAFLAAQQALQAKKLEHDGLKRRMEFLGTTQGQLEILRENWNELCPSCRKTAGLPPLSAVVEADEIAEEEAALAKTKILISEQETKLAKRKADNAS